MVTLPGQFATRFLRKDGSINMAVDGSSTSELFSYVVPSGFTLLLDTIFFTLIDGGSCNTDRFGAFTGSSSVLDNGCRFVMLNPNGAVTLDFLDGERIKKNGDFKPFAQIVDLICGDRGVGVTWNTFITVPAGFGIVTEINDDLTDLISFTCSLRGRIFGTGEAVPTLL